MYKIRKIIVGVNLPHIQKCEGAWTNTGRRLSWIDFQFSNEDNKITTTPVSYTLHKIIDLDELGVEPMLFTDIESVVKYKSFINKLIKASTYFLSEYIVPCDIKKDDILIEVIKQIFDSCSFRNHLSKSVLGIPFGEFDPNSEIEINSHKSHTFLVAEREPTLDLMAIRRKLLIEHIPLTESEHIELLLRYDELLRKDDILV